MIDLRDIGSAGLLIQYEDIIAMIGYNIAKQFRTNHLSEKLDSMTIQEVLSSYLNREDEDYSVWLKKEFDIDIDPKAMSSSFLSMQPNLLYAYRIFPASLKVLLDSVILNYKICHLKFSLPLRKACLVTILISQMNKVKKSTLFSHLSVNIS
jgi:hypothetical protein